LHRKYNRLKHLFALLLVLICAGAHAQKAAKPLPEGFQRVEQIFSNHPVYHFYATPVLLVIESRKEVDNDGIFYYIVGLVLYLALIRIIFHKYFSTLFTLFFHATLRQQQLREQLLQSPLPALLLNIFYMVVVGTYFTFLARYFRWPLAGNFWYFLMYATLLVAAVYSGKYILLNIAGWIFGVRNLTTTYLFIVFLVNKMIGMFLLPVVIMQAFPNPVLLPWVLLASYILLGCVLLYRIILTYRPAKSEIRLNRLHFFLYLCAFEIAPLLLIYKVLLAHVVRL